MYPRMTCGVAAAFFAAVTALTARAEGPAEGSSPGQIQPRPTVSQLIGQAQKERNEPTEGQQGWKPSDALVNDIDAVLPPFSEYWLGVVVSRPSAGLREKLRLPQDTGLLVEHVEPNSPAAAAGIKPNDVLMKANDKPLRELRDLWKLINEVKEGKLTLLLARDGATAVTVTATLAKRPGGGVRSFSREAQAWIEMLDPSRGFLVVGPGQILPSDAKGEGGVAATNVEIAVHTKVSLADGLQIEITREDGKPAKVLVTREKERWEGTSDDLSKIPETIRPEVERIVRSSMDHLHLLVAPGGPAQSSVLYLGGGQAATADRASLEKRLNEMQNQIDELKQQVKALQDSAKPKKE